MWKNNKKPTGGKDAEKEKTGKANFSGRAFSGRAEARQANALLSVIILLLFVFIIWQDWNYRSQIIDIANKQWVVFHETCDGNVTAGDASQYQSGPDETTINSLASKVIGLIEQTGSENAASSYKEAIKWMTPQSGAALKIAGDEEVRALTEAKQNNNVSIYRKLENDVMNVRTITIKDFPPGTKINLSKYDVAIYGRIFTYDSATNKPIKPQPDTFFYHVKLVPLKSRTLENPWGVIVESIQKLDPVKSLGTAEEVEKKKKEEAAQQQGGIFSLGKPESAATPAP